MTGKDFYNTNEIAVDVVRVSFKSMILVDVIYKSGIEHIMQ